MSSFTFYVDFYFPNLTIFQLSCHLLIKLAHVHGWLLQRNSSFRCNLSSSPFNREFGRHLDVNVSMVSPLCPRLYLLLLYCKKEGSWDPLSCKFCQWRECTYAWSHCVQLSGWLLSVCPAHVWHTGFPSHPDAPTNPRGRNTVDRVQMDSLGIWQILEMDFTACQNKQCFSAWGSQRNGQRGLR